jgi:gamma-butyrobetaine dioxygenase
MAWSAVASDDWALADWLTTVVADGWAHLTGVPDGDTGLLAVVARFGYVRETNDGRIFDVPTDVGPGGPLHTANPYRRPAPSLQLLHRGGSPAGRNNNNNNNNNGGGGGGGGGGTILVDGFLAADVLRAERPEAFAQLATWPVRWRYADDTVDLVAEAPVIELGAGGAIVSIRFDERSRVPLQLDPDVVDLHLLALRRFATILDRPQLQVRLALDAGDVVLLDGRRMLHGWAGGEPAGAAWFRGCYVDRDGLDSRLAVLRRHAGDTEPGRAGSTPADSPLPGPRRPRPRGHGPKVAIGR